MHLTFNYALRLTIQADYFKWDYEIGRQLKEKTNFLDSDKAGFTIWINKFNNKCGINYQQLNIIEPLILTFILLQFMYVQ